MILKRCVFGLLVVAGCAKTESSDLLTSGIYADLEAHATNNGQTTVSATLYVDDPSNLNFVELTGDDQLTATTGSDHMTLEQSELGNIVSHTAVFPVDAAGTEFDIAFDRSVDDGAPKSSVVLPDKFDPGPAPATASRAAPVTLTWSPAGSADTMVWVASGTCVTATAGTITGDTGSVTIPAATFTKPAGQGVADSCMLTLTITRKRMGTVDAHYGKGGLALGAQDRTMTWMSMP
jgi:hypothetical protein